MKHPNWYGKVTTSHSTVTETAGEVVGNAAKMSVVSKIILSEIRVVRGGRRKISFKSLNGGIKAVVRGSGAIQDIIIYTNSPDLVSDTLMKAFEK
jgi:hypothetical protein